MGDGAPPKTAFAGIPRRRGKPLDMRSLSRNFLWRKDFSARHRSLAARVQGGPRPLISCPVCGGGALQPFASIHGFPYVECAACGLVFSLAPPTEAAVRRIYAEDAEARSSQAKAYADERLFARRVDLIARPKVEHVKAIVPPAGLWIDVGCATGEILTAAREAGWDVLGIESDPVEVEFAQRRGLVVREDFVTKANAPQLLAGASVVSLLNVLEHVNQPGELLRAVAAPLACGGHVVIEAPRHPSLSSFANLVFPDLACRHLYAPEHLHVFSERAMEILLAQAGLLPVSVWIFGQDFQELVADAALTAGIGETRFYGQVVDCTPAVQQALDDSDFADALFVIARKE